MDHGAHEAVRGALELSLRAPSEHNTQPWRWVLHPDRLELFADQGRRLPFTDPEGRGTLVACGCALHHLRVALGAAGWRADVVHRGGGDRGLAEVRVRRAGEAPEDDRRQASAIERRRSDRRRFSDRDVDCAGVEALVEAARRWGGTLDLVVGATRGLLVEAMADAGREQFAWEGYAAELQRWTHRFAGGHDGVPRGTRTADPAEPSGPDGDVVLRRFPGGTLRESWRTAQRRDAALLFVLSAVDESAVSTLRAGEALSAVLLEATARGLATTPLTQVFEVAETRERVRHLVNARRRPLVVVRVGHPAPGGEEVPATPRRPLCEVLAEAPA